MTWRRHLQHAFEYSTEMKEGVREAKLSYLTPSIRFGIWVNLTNKGGRMRSIPYPDLDLTIDVPKAIAAQLIAVRVMHLVRGLEEGCMICSCAVSMHAMCLCRCRVQNYDHAACAATYAAGVNAVIDKYTNDLKAAGSSATAGGGRARSAGRQRGGTRGAAAAGGNRRASTEGTSSLL